MSLELARDRRAEMRRQIAAGIDPSQTRKAERIAQASSFRAVADEWLELQRSKLSPATLAKARWMLEDLLFPDLGNKAISSIMAPDLPVPLRRHESRGRHETAHRVKQRAGQVFRYAIATGRAERAPSADLRGALAPVSSVHR